MRRRGLATARPAACTASRRMSSTKKREPKREPAKSHKSGLIAARSRAQPLQSARIPHSGCQSGSRERRGLELRLERASCSTFAAASSSTSRHERVRSFSTTLIRGPTRSCVGYSRAFALARSELLSRLGSGPATKRAGATLSSARKKEFSQDRGALVQWRIFHLENSAHLALAGAFDDLADCRELARAGIKQEHQQQEHTIDAHERRHLLMMSGREKRARSSRRGEDAPSARALISLPQLLKKHACRQADLP